jgi:hypothetical protein
MYVSVSESQAVLLRYWQKEILGVHHSGSVPALFLRANAEPPHAGFRKRV